MSALAGPWDAAAHGTRDSLPEQFRRVFCPPAQLPALQRPGQVEQEYWFETAQNAPNTESVNPPAEAHCQLFESMYRVGAVLHTVAASFHARHAAESPVLYG